MKCKTIVFLSLLLSLMAGVAACSDEDALKENNDEGYSLSFTDELVEKEKLSAWIVEKLDSIHTSGMAPTLDVFEVNWRNEEIYLIINFFHESLLSMASDDYWDAKGVRHHFGKDYNDFFLTSRNWRRIYRERAPGYEDFEYWKE